jgi:hypothetical protein
MPIHDWTRVDAGLFHHFRHRWIDALCDALPDMPLFLKPGIYVPAPLEATYQSSWQVFPAPLKRLVE